MYDFKTLSSYDFELLSRDLLQRRLQTVLESFKAGRDDGIDLRHASAKDGSLIVQCKHYVRTGYRGLLAALKKERAKVQRLTPNRYCIVTSVPLSPANKKDIRNIFDPFCSSDTDVFGQEDINNFLGLYPDIELQHFKLWLTSSVVLERIVHSDVYNQTQALVEAIHRKFKLYVQNESFSGALEILKEHNYCVISGIPGIGKTFLAEILLLEHIRHGFEPVVVRSHISEAFKLLKADRRQVFFYDDFLGQTGWEDKLEKNEEQTILDFITYVRQHTHAIFILTTREYILQQARNVYEKLHAADFDHAKCIITLESYTRHNKAHILFNHIYFSDLSADHRRYLARKENLLKIVDHPNYSPRIVEWMAGLSHVRDHSAKEYPRLFLHTLDNPTMLWQHAYRNHLTPVARSLLIVLFSFHIGVEMDDLKEAFESFRIQEVKILGVARAPNELEGALDEMEGSFVRCEREFKAIVVSFHNPSVRDFMERHLANNTEQAEILCEGLVFYDQFRTVFTPQATRHQRTPIRLGDAAGESAVVNAALRTVSRTAKRHVLSPLADGTVVVHNLVETTAETNAAHALRMAKDLQPDQAALIAEGILKEEIERLEQGVAILTDLPEVVKASGYYSKIEDTRNTLIAKASRAYEAIELYEELEDIVALKDFIEVAPSAVSDELIRKVGEELSEKSDDIFSCQISDAEDEGELDDLSNTATVFEDVFGASMAGIHMQIAEQRDEIQTRYEEPPDDWHEATETEPSDDGDSEIIAMFGSMFE